MRLIDADELLKDEYQHYDYLFDEYYVRVKDIESAPTIEKRQRGKWIESNDIIIRGTCSCCGWDAIAMETDVVGMPFCPNCGAKMDEKENE